jgi:hypothetical protein
MVGSLGGKTAVANNDQIVEAVSAGVYQAVSSALSQGTTGGETPVFNLYIDGRQVDVADRKANRDRGAIIGTGGLVYG